MPETVERSAKVRGYVKTTLKYRKMAAKLAEAEAKLVPVRREVAELHADLKQRWARMNGPQQRHAERLLAQPAELLHALSRPCKTEHANA